MNDFPARGIESEGEASGYGVADIDEFDGDVSQLFTMFWGDDVKVGFIIEVVFDESSSNERDGQIGGIDREFPFHASVFKGLNEVWNGPDVVFVSVCDEEGVWRIAFQDGEIGRNEIDAEIFVGREEDAAIDEDPTFWRSDEEAVHTEHACSADGKNSYTRLRAFIRILRALNFCHVNLQLEGERNRNAFQAPTSVRSKRMREHTTSG